MDLFDVYKHNALEHDASLVRRDGSFKPIVQFNEELFEEMVDIAADDELIATAEEIAAVETARIVNSRLRNPDVPHFITS